jgi:hypothetical protein
VISPPSFKTNRGGRCSRCGYLRFAETEYNNDKGHALAWPLSSIRLVPKEGLEPSRF